MYRAVIFDLDGTLLDTLDDLTDAVNAALSAFDFPHRTREEVKSFIGDGVALLVQRSLPQTCSEEIFSSVLAHFKKHYAAHCQDKTQPYPGIMPLLNTLQNRGIRTGIVSNKFDGAVKTLSNHYFGKLIDVSVGERESEGIRKKPAPDTLLMAMKELSVIPEEILYVGDSDTDILTARNAGVACVSVTWGFRDRSFLITHGAEILVDSPAELQFLPQLKGSFYEIT